MIAVASLIVLIAVIAFSAVTKKNAGVVGLVAAYIFSIAAAKCGTEINVSKVVTGNWPTSVFFIVLATTFLFGIATLNGTTQALSKNIVCLARGNAKILPVILVIANEHIGHQLVTSKVVGRDLLKDPGLHRSLFADNFSTMISGFIGSVPTTTYGENIGVMAIPKVYSVRVIGGAAVLSIICSFVGPLAALIQTIPGPVIGGISFLLYGMIGTSGLRILVDNHVDYSKNRNMILTSVIFVTGLSGVTLALGDVSLSGMTLAAIVGMIMSLVFYAFDKFHLSNDA